jgi:fumarate reductase subunit D
MHAEVLFPAFGTWLLILALAMANGAFRETVLSPRIGTAVAHVISTFILLVAVVLLSWLFVRRFADRYDASDMLQVGVVWLVLTLLFEFGLGYLRGYSWEKMLADYNVLNGRVWVLIPLAVLIAPSLIYRVMKK